MSANQPDLTDLSQYSITTGDVFSPNDATLVLTSDARLNRNPDDDHSYLARFRNWSDLRLVESGWPVRSQERSTSEPDLVLSLSARGRVRASRTVGGGADEASIYQSLPALSYTRTMINDVYDVFGYFCAIGTRRAVYRRTAISRWVQMDESCYDAKAFESEFRGLVGVDKYVLYAVGTQGEIWRFDGHWTREDSGTNQDFNAACVDGQGNVYAAGAGGACLRGRKGSWAEVNSPADGFTFWSITEYRGEIYATANLSLVLQLDRKNGEFNPVDFGECRIPGTAYHLKVRDDMLYSFGTKDIRRFDGRSWDDLLSLD